MHLDFIINAILVYYPYFQSKNISSNIFFSTKLSLVNDLTQEDFNHTSSSNSYFYQI